MCLDQGKAPANVQQDNYSLLESEVNSEWILEPDLSQVVATCYNRLIYVKLTHQFLNFLH